MQTRVLGKNKLEVSAIGLGCMTIGKDYSPEDRKKWDLCFQTGDEWKRKGSL